MTFLDARTKYRRADDGLLAEIATPHQMILITLRELHKSLSILAAAQIDGQKYNGQHLTRATTAVYVLQSSLDFEKGGEIADNLFRVYEFVRLQVLAALQRNPKAQLTAARDYIGEIMSAWQSMPNAG